MAFSQMHNLSPIGGDRSPRNDLSPIGGDRSGTGVTRLGVSPAIAGKTAVPDFRGQVSPTADRSTCPRPRRSIAGTGGQPGTEAPEKSTFGERMSLPWMTLTCPTCPTIRTRKIHPGGRLEGIGAFTQAWIFHTCDPSAGRMCPDCLVRAKSSCERCSDRAGLVSQLGNPTYRRRRYSRADVTTTPSPGNPAPAGHDRKA